MLEENSRAIMRREEEINSVVQSIQDLNTIFRDLASMVTEQGEVVDRIDYIIGITNIKIEADIPHCYNSRLQVPR